MLQRRGSLGALLFLVLGACGPGLDEDLESPEFRSTIRAATYDPHVPRGGPWFEGWYTRVTDTENRRSFAVVVGSHVPRGASAPAPEDMLSGYVGLLVSEGEEGAPTEAYGAFPERTRASIDGSPVRTDPAREGSPRFAWIAEGLGVFTERNVALELPGEASVTMDLGPRVPFNAAHPDLGPEGRLGRLPLPLHWDVYSLASPARYTLGRMKDGRWSTVEGSGVAHMEKNWGSTFPEAWIWAQGVDPDGTSQLVLSVGRVRVGGIAAEPWTVALRAPGVDWTLSIASLGAALTRNSRPCEGTVELVARDPVRTLHIEAHAAPSTFGPIAIPTRDGFVTDRAHESFSAEITVRASEHDPLGGLLGFERPVHEVTFRGAALEFGQAFGCPDDQARGEAD